MNASGVKSSKDSADALKDIKAVAISETSVFMDLQSSELVLS
jgi:hypothetical protein